LYLKRGCFDLKLNVLKIALADAIITALLMFLLPLDVMYLGKGLRLVTTLGGLLPGYAATWQGAGLGAVYGFVICFIYVGLVGGLYNSSLGWKGLKLKGKAKAKPAKKKK
jgi:hypothetical protein